MEADHWGTAMENEGEYQTKPLGLMMMMQDRSEKNEGVREEAEKTVGEKERERERDHEDRKGEERAERGEG